MRYSLAHALPCIRILYVCCDHYEDKAIMNINNYEDNGIMPMKNINLKCGGNHTIGTHVIVTSSLVK